MKLSKYNRMNIDSVNLKKYITKTEDIFSGKSTHMHCQKDQNLCKLFIKNEGASAGIIDWKIQQKRELRKHLTLNKAYKLPEFLFSHY